jgi:hypothetical protein
MTRDTSTRSAQCAQVRPYEFVARQLGNADVQMVARIWGRRAPRSDERDRWEKIAAELDVKQETKVQKSSEMVP